MIKVAGVPLNVVFILVVELTERFSYYTISNTLRSFLQTVLGFNLATSQSIASCFTTAGSLSALLGGTLGDRFLGRFLTVGFLVSLYSVGVVLVAFSAKPSDTQGQLIGDWSSGLVAFGLVFLGVGMKPCVLNFGADQIEMGEDTAKLTEKYFGYFFWMANIGAAASFGLSAMPTSPAIFGIQEGQGFFYAYLIAAASMLSCLIVFFVGSCSYTKKFLTDNTRIFRPVLSALWYSATQSCRGAIALVGWLLTLPFFTLSFIQAFSQEKNHLAYAACIVAFIQLGCLIYAHIDNSFIVERGAQDGVTAGDESRLMNGRIGQISLQEIRETFQTIPVTLFANTMFFFAYSLAVQGPFFSQSCQMDLNLNGSGSSRQINGTLFTISDAFAIIIFLPIFDRFLYPMIERRLNRAIFPHEKFVGGFVLAALAMSAAILLEVLRHDAGVLSPPSSLGNSTYVFEYNATGCVGWLPGQTPPASCQNNFPCIDFSKLGPENGNSANYYMGQCKFGPPGDLCNLTSQTIANNRKEVNYPLDYCSSCAPKSETTNAGIYMSEFSGYWMFIPYSFMGLGEVMVQPVIFYYVYSMTPRRTQSIIQAVNLVFGGAYPAALVSVCSTLLTKNQPNNLNDGHIWKFYVVSLVSLFVGTPLFLLVRAKCVLNMPEAQEDMYGDDQFSSSRASRSATELAPSWTEGTEATVS